MNAQKRHQPALDIDQQIQNLRQNGLQIKDEEFAKTVLNEVSYYRLIKAYGLEYKKRNASFSANTTFEHIIYLYKFDLKFRHQIFQQIETVEIMLRCRLGNYLSSKYGIHGYMNGTIFANPALHPNFIYEVNEALRRNANSPFVTNFRKNYVPDSPPFYALVEILSFGTLSKFYKNLNGKDKKEISKNFGIGYTYLESWLECLAFVRNRCAHYARLYNVDLTISPRLYKQYKERQIDEKRIFSVLLCMKHIIGLTDDWMHFSNSLEKILLDFSQVDKNRIGFPSDWLDLLTQDKREVNKIEN